MEYVDFRFFPVSFYSKVILRYAIADLSLTASGIARLRHLSHRFGGRTRRVTSHTTPCWVRTRTRRTHPGAKSWQSFRKTKIRAVATTGLGLEVVTGQSSSACQSSSVPSTTSIWATPLSTRTGKLPLFSNFLINKWNQSFKCDWSFTILVLQWIWCNVGWSDYPIGWHSGHPEEEEARVASHSAGVTRAQRPGQDRRRGRGEHKRFHFFQHPFPIWIISWMFLQIIRVRQEQEKAEKQLRRRSTSNLLGAKKGSDAGLRRSHSREDAVVKPFQSAQTR